MTSGTDIFSYYQSTKTTYQRALQIATLRQDKSKPEEGCYSNHTVPQITKLIERADGDHHGLSTGNSKTAQDDIPVDLSFSRETCSASANVVDKVAPGEFGFDAWPEDSDFLFPIEETSSKLYKPCCTNFTTDINSGSKPILRDDMHVPRAVSSMLFREAPGPAQATQPYEPDVPAYNLHYVDQASDILAVETLHHWCAPCPDASIPTTDVERQGWVSKLVNAINNRMNVFDAPSLTFNKRWISDTSYYCPASKEIEAWNVLSLAELLSTTGKTALLSFDPIACKHAAKTRSWTFSERMERIIELLTCSKARCEKLLAGLGAQMLVGNPDTIMRMTKCNGIQNKKRQAVLEAGRK
ncbi:hypothetical protein FB567DRAFT_588775 [Paraphoma chrysanthemicola]|uniref:Uncharacterized protein n=1 Tax=Paraphoma chrysanthemicola TaxID=798071 RepID=A0A8K0RG98_9PLEO|nr:hypothetical protein FB567DRAFT_588775 [Paraphoma chrysanthemicola]